MRLSKLWTPEAPFNHPLLTSALVITTSRFQEHRPANEQMELTPQCSASEEQWKHNLIPVATLWNPVTTAMALIPNDDLLSRSLWTLIPWSKSNIWKQRVCLYFQLQRVWIVKGPFSFLPFLKVMDVHFTNTSLTLLLLLRWEVMSVCIICMLFFNWQKWNSWF